MVKRKEEQISVSEMVKMQKSNQGTDKNKLIKYSIWRKRGEKRNDMRN